MHGLRSLGIDIKAARNTALHDLTKEIDAAHGHLPPPSTVHLSTVDENSMPRMIFGRTGQRSESALVLTLDIT
jgi:hypothetical protein